MTATKTKQRIDWAAIKAKLAANEQALQRGLEPSQQKLEETLAKRAEALANRAAKRRERTDTDRILVVALGDARFGLPISLPLRSKRWS